MQLLSHDRKQIRARMPRDDQLVPEVTETGEHRDEIFIAGDGLGSLFHANHLAFLLPYHRPKFVFRSEYFRAVRPVALAVRV